MIQVTRLDNTTLIVNAEMIKTVQSTPDTVITFTNNTKMVVRTFGRNFIHDCSVPQICTRQ